MKLLIRDNANELIKSITLKKFDLYQNIIEDLNNLQKPATAILITAHEKINSYEFSKFKLTLETLNIVIIHIYSFNRETVLSGKSLKINSTLVKNKDLKNKFYIDPSFNQKDIIHKGTVRSGDRISSNGNLVIIGDVNPGAIVSAKNNVYVWGKLSGIALAGKNGDKKALIASLCLNPLQLRISDIVAIGPKEKLKHHYPEVAVIEGKSIIIKPYIMTG